LGRPQVFGDDQVELLTERPAALEPNRAAARFHRLIVPIGGTFFGIAHARFRSTIGTMA
jgi:hypothetical protein